ncbi:efflux RND transporter periplasmic adaptor subunit [Limimaricola litoreus]
MRFLRRSLSGLFLLAMTLGLLALAGQMLWSAVEERMNAAPRSFPQQERVAGVRSLTITPERTRPELIVFGELLSSRTVALRASVGGIVQDVAEAMVEGGAVTAGDLLLQIDPADAESALARARVDLEDALSEAREAERALELARDELAAAEAQAVLREQALTRQRGLQERGIGTAPELEAAELSASSAAQAVLTRRQAIAQAETRIDQAATRRARADIAVAEAERDLANTRITAPFDGQLTEVAISPGSRVTANEQLAVLVDPDALEVAFRISATQYARLLGGTGRIAGAPVSVRLDVDGLPLTGAGRVVREAAVVAQGQTGRLIYAALDRAPGLRPGDFVTVIVTEPPLDDVAAIPAAALGADGTVLVIGPEDRLESVAVELLRTQGDAVLIAAGDLAGREIVARRTPLLGAGIKVRRLGDTPADPGADPETAPQMIALDDARRARLMAFVEASDRMPAEARARLIKQLEAEEVPAEVVDRLEGRMGG